MDKSNLADSEKRDYFRIDDKMEFSYYILKENQSGEHDEHLFDEGSQKHFEIMQQFQEIDAAKANLTPDLFREQPQLTEYLQLLDQKINLITHEIFKMPKSQIEEVNISVGGIGFTSPNELEKGTKIRVKIVLLSNYYGFIADAKVVMARDNASEDPQYPYYVAAEFIDLPDDVRQMLYKHILHRQTNDLRTK